MTCSPGWPSVMYQPICGLVEQLVWSAQQIALVVPSRSPLAFAVSCCCCRVPVGRVFRLAKRAVDLAFQVLMFQSQMPYSVCTPVENAAGAVLVSGVFSPVPKSIITRGNPNTGPEATMSFVVGAGRAGAGSGGPPAGAPRGAGGRRV